MSLDLAGATRGTRSDLRLAAELRSHLGANGITVHLHNGAVIARAAVFVDRHGPLLAERETALRRLLALSTAGQQWRRPDCGRKGLAKLMKGSRSPAICSCYWRREMTKQLLVAALLAIAIIAVAAAQSMEQEVQEQHQRNVQQVLPRVTVFCGNDLEGPMAHLPKCAEARAVLMRCTNRSVAAGDYLAVARSGQETFANIKAGLNASRNGEADEWRYGLALAEAAAPNVSPPQLNKRTWDVCITTMP